MARVPSNEPTEELEHPFSKDSPLCLDGQIRPLSDHIVAGGGHSDIYMGELQLAGGQKQTVAIKVIRAFNWQKNSKVVQKLIRRTWREFAAWSTLSHPNIMEFIGYSFDFVSGPAPGLVSPWMKNGTLYSYLEENPTVERFPLILGVAQGLCYLHSQNPPVVHGDLRTTNILMGDTGIPQLTDFSLSRRIGDTLNLTTTADTAGTIRWMAPEQFSGEKVTTASDVWSYGMTILEIITGKPPYCYLSKEPEVIASICRGQIPNRPDLQIDAQYLDWIWSECIRCWAFEPSQRISIVTIEEGLRTISLETTFLSQNQNPTVSSPDIQEISAEVSVTTFQPQTRPPTIKDLPIRLAPGTKPSSSSPPSPIVTDEAFIRQTFATRDAALRQTGQRHPLMISPAVTQPVQLPENSSRRGSALSPLSTTPFPADDPTPPVNPGQRLARRTFDPARGVELFKQVTEETLYRFLKNSNPWNGEDLALGNSPSPPVAENIDVYPVQQNILPPSSLKASKPTSHLLARYRQYRRVRFSPQIQFFQAHEQDIEPEVLDPLIRIKGVRLERYIDIRDLRTARRFLYNIEEEAATSSQPAETVELDLPKELLDVLRTLEIPHPLRAADVSQTIEEIHAIIRSLKPERRF